MRFIISNKIYDTEKAEKLCVFSKQWETSTIFGTLYPYHNTTLYRTAKGAYFLVGDFDYDRGKIEVITEAEAKTYLMHYAYNRYVEMFGELEEA